MKGTLVALVMFSISCAVLVWVTYDAVLCHYSMVESGLYRYITDSNWDPRKLMGWMALLSAATGMFIEMGLAYGRKLIREAEMDQVALRLKKM